MGIFIQLITMGILFGNFHSEGVSMTELKFYTDGEKYYLNNEHGVTKEVDLSALSGEVSNIVFTEVSEDDYSIPFSYNDIANLISDNKTLIANLGNVCWLYLSRILYNQYGYNVYFITVATGGNNVIVQPFNAKTPNEHLKLLD